MILLAELTFDFTTMVWLAMIAVKATLIVGTGLLVATVLRRATARSRQLVLIATLTLTVLLPLATLVLPGADVSPWLQLSPTESISTGDNQPLTESSLTQQRAALSASVATAPMAEMRLESTSKPVVQQTNTALVNYWQRGMGIVVFLWLLGVGVGAVWYARQLLSAAIIVARSHRAPEEIRVIASRCTKDIPELRLSEQAEIPFAWGWLRPVIVLPKDALSWNHDHLRLVLEHELVHIRHRDWLGLQVAWLCCLLHWFNPLVWLVARRLRIESECVCDEIIANRPIVATDYADMLVFLARRIRDRRVLRTVVAVAGESALEFRVKRILQLGNENRRQVNLWVVPVLAALSLGGTTANPQGQIESTGPAGTNPELQDIWSTELVETLTVDTDIHELSIHASNGSVQLKPGPRFQVTATVRVDRNQVDSASLVADFEKHILVEQSNSQLRIADQHMLDAADSQTNNPWQVDFVVQVPRMLDIDITGGRGDIDVRMSEKILQHLNLQTGLGSISVDAQSLSGPVNLNVANGNISLRSRNVGDPNTTHLLSVSRGNIHLTVPGAGLLTLKSSLGRVLGNGHVADKSIVRLTREGPTYNVLTGLGNIEYHVQ